MLELLRCQIRELQCWGRQRQETIVVAIYPCRETFIVNVHDLGSQVAISRVVPPECVDIEHLNVDAALVQFPNAVGAQRASTLREAVQRRPLDDVRDLRDAGMRVHIDHLDELPAYANIAMHDGSVGRARLTLPAALSTALRGCITHEGTVCSPQSRRRT